MERFSPSTTALIAFFTLFLLFSFFMSYSIILLTILLFKDFMNPKKAIASKTEMQ